MIFVTFDIPDAPVFQMHFDSASARAHVTGRILHLVSYFWRGVDLLRWTGKSLEPVTRAFALRRRASRLGRSKRPERRFEYAREVGHWFAQVNEMKSGEV